MNVDGGKTIPVEGHSLAAGDVRSGDVGGGAGGVAIHGATGCGSTGAERGRGADARGRDLGGGQGSGGQSPVCVSSPNELSGRSKAPDRASGGGAREAGADHSDRRGDDDVL